jgi:hypothetical protein
VEFINLFENFGIFGVVFLIFFLIILVVSIRRMIGGYTGRRICPDCGLELHSYKRNCPSYGRIFK